MAFLAYHSKAVRPELSASRLVARRKGSPQAASYRPLASELQEFYLSGPTPEQWRRILLDREEGPATEERFSPLRSRKGLTSAEHFARYLFASGLCAGKRVLDIACGSGYGAYILKIMGAAEVIGVDASAEAID